MSPERKRL